MEATGVAPISAPCLNARPRRKALASDVKMSRSKGSGCVIFTGGKARTQKQTICQTLKSAFLHLFPDAEQVSGIKPLSAQYFPDRRCPAIVHHAR